MFSLIKKRTFSRLYLVFFFLFITSSLLFAQEKYTLSGYVKDNTSADPLLFVNIVDEDTRVGIVSNEFGFYSFDLPAGEHTLVFSFIGYETAKIPIVLSENTTLDVDLSPELQALDEVVVEGERLDANVTQVQTSVNKLQVKELEKVPVIFGERDPLKVVQLLPGVSSASEASSGFFVRGGSVDQNLVLIDQAELYNPSHFLGIFSVFNSDAIKDLTLYKGEQPAEYGGRLSSVLDVRTRDANVNEVKGKGGIGLIASRAGIELPLWGENNSLFIAGRRTYSDLFTPLSEDLKNTNIFFYDFNVKANFLIDDRNKLYISSYIGNDIVDIKNGPFELGFDWGNNTLTASWNHIFSPKVFSSTTASFNRYDYIFGIGDGKIISSVQDFGLAQGFQYFYSPTSEFKFGGSAKFHTYVPGKIEFEEGSQSSAADTDEELSVDRFAMEYAAYFSHKWKPIENLSIIYGVRYSHFSVLSPTTLYEFDDRRDIISEEKIDEIGVVKNYGFLEPRIGVNFSLDESSSLKAGYARNTQYVHVLSNSNAGTPFDTYIPSTALIKPQRAEQTSVGYFRNFLDNSIETSLEGYYKHMWNLADYKENEDIFEKKAIEAQIVSGIGWSYGLELLIRKKRGRFTGWISYTWSVTQRKFDEINRGRTYTAPEDRTHNVSVVGIFELSKTWTLSTSWVYTTGAPVTLPTGFYIYQQNKAVTVYNERNSFRLPDYHRLDLNLTWDLETESFDSSLDFSIYNAYLRKNAFTLQVSPAENETTGERQNSFETNLVFLFQIVPSVTWNFEF